MVANVHKDGSETIYFIHFGDDDDQSFLGLLCWGPFVFPIKNAINIKFVYYIVCYLSNMSPIFLFSFPLFHFVTYLNSLNMSLHLISN